jgi:ribose transport system substrate-binding protein
MNKLTGTTLFLVLCASILAPNRCRGEESKDQKTSKPTPQYAFITNGAADFWEHARAGANKAAEDLKVKVDVITPGSTTDQTRKIEDLLTRGIDGIAISPIDPANQAEAINNAAAKTNLITHDSDAPQTNRLVYIGMDNYQAGLICGKTLRDAMPEGGKVMIFVGRIDQDNAARRRNGFIDGFLGNEADATHNYPASDELTSGDKKYTVLGTITDNFDKAKAKSNVEDAVTRNPNIDGMVGLFGYNPPLILEALDRVHKLGKIKVMAFDEDNGTLQGIKDGNVVATTVQNPYQYGYQSVKVLNELHNGNKSVIPESKFIDIPARVITPKNVDEFWAEVKSHLPNKHAGGATWLIVGGLIVVAVVAFLAMRSRPKPSGA